jgi:hypothetical protein
MWKKKRRIEDLRRGERFRCPDGRMTQRLGADFQSTSAMSLDGFGALRLGGYHPAPAMEWWNKYMPLKLPELESWSFSTNLSSSALEQNATRDARNLKISDTAPSPYSSRLSHTFKKRNAPQAAPLPARRPLHSLPNGCNAATRSIFGFYFKVPPILHPRHEPQSRTDRDKPAIPV